ncbi:MAG: autotransporter domain-containing protein [Rhodobacteraceae bacterium]|nr:autotransporter domain-containing protein [Paracoccaceae bacterium]
MKRALSLTGATILMMLFAATPVFASGGVRPPAKATINFEGAGQPSTLKLDIPQGLGKDDLKKITFILSGSGGGFSCNRNNVHFITKEVVSKYDEDEHGDPIKNRVSNRYKRFKYQAGDKIEFDVTLCATAVGKMFRVHWRSDSAIGLFEGFDASRPNCYTDAQCYTDVTVTDNKPKVSTKETEDQSPVISITGSAAITEGDTATFTLTAAPKPTTDITVTVDVADSGGFAGSDQIDRRTVIIGIDGTATLSVTTDDDSTDEPDGTLTATVQAGTDYAPSDTAATATITVSDNDVSDSNQPETRSDSGRPAISITDAVGMEGQDLEFPVALDAATRDSVTVEWATEPGTATADVDYMETSGTLTFQPGETTKTISVATIDDDHHDDGEIFKVILSNPTGASISDGEATGTIENADLVPGNWIARFGQVVGELVVRAVQVRMQMPKSTGITGEIGGYALRSNADPEIKDESSTSVTPRNDTSVLKTGYSKRHPHAFGDPEVVPVYVPLDMSMIATRETADGEGLISIWGQGSWSGFKDDDVIDGQATNFLLGIDHRKGRWLTGLAIGRSSGEGGWTGTDDRMGTISMTLSGFYPYLGYSLSDRASIWGVAGYGSGDLKLTTPDDETFKTDATLTMAAAGLRAIIIEGETDKSPTISVLADGMTTRTESDAVPGLGATDGKRTRLRLGLESSWNFTSDNGMITPRTEISLRHDGGDGEDGMGIELGVGVGYQSHDNALTFDFSGRSVAINSNSDFREWSVSTSLMYDPRPNTDRGLAVSLNQSTGTGLAGDVDSLMNTAAAEDFVQQQDPMKSGSLQAEAAYGVPAFGGRMTGAPLVGYSLSDDVRETKIGWRLTPERPKWGSFELATEVTRSDPANDDDSEYALGVQSVMQW